MEALLIKQSPHPTHAQRKETNNTYTQNPKTTQNPKPLILLPRTLDLYFLLSEI